MTLLSQIDADGALSEAFLVEVLSSLVKTPSVNPGIYEVAMAERVCAWLDSPVFSVKVVEFAPGRPSVAVVLGGTGEGPRLVLNGHMDTVPVDDEQRWTSSPFDPAVRDGFLYGRGACDMKAGLAVQIGVLHHLAALGRPLRGTLLAHFAAGEECGEPGTLSLLREGFTGHFGITTEPTELKVAVAERGLCHFRIEIKGRSIHASRAHLGLNPVPVLRDVLQVVEEYDREVGMKEHPLLPSGSCEPTVVRGGVKENAIPDVCELYLDRRMLPGESVQGELAVLNDRLEVCRRRGVVITVAMSATSLPFEPAEIPKTSEFATEMTNAVAAVTGSPGEVYGTPYSSDVRNLINDAGIEAVTFGPGNVAECHCTDERVAVDQVRDAARVIAQVARKLLV